MKTAEEILNIYNIDRQDERSYSRSDIISAMEEYRNQFTPAIKEQDVEERSKNNFLK